MSVTQLRTGRYQARVFNPTTGRRITRSFDTADAARDWHDEVADQVRLEGWTPPSAAEEAPTFVAHAARWWMDLAEKGIVRARGGGAYKPGVLYQYRRMWEVSLFGAFGDKEVGRVRRRDVQRHVDTMVAAGHAPNTVRNSVTALRAFYRWAVREELTDANPCEGLELPSGETARDRIVSPHAAARQVRDLYAANYIEASRVWAAAFFLGLRRGELAALRCCDVDLVARRVRVERSYDYRTQTYGAPKSKAGTRDVGIPNRAVAPLREALAGRTDGAAVWGPELVRRASVAARAVFGEDALTLHEARHTYASMMIDAGVNIKTISTWMGHADVSITLNRYGHLMPGAGDAALEQLDRYLG